MSDASFPALRLHDATLVSVSVAWASRGVQAEVLLCQLAGEEGERVLRLRWTGCSRVAIPHEQPWGPSKSINSHGCEGRRFWIEMQSGDVIELWADGFSVE
jgi:hypothetical protein